jgi:hypothetical protein
MRKPPRYIESAHIIQAPINYKWDDVDPAAICGDGDSKLSREIGFLSNQATAALSAGIAEWVAWRLKEHCTEPVLFQKIEAVWAGVIDWHYMQPRDAPSHSLEKSDFQGPARGPIRLAVQFLTAAADAARRGKEPSPHTGCLGKLATHVLKKSKSYQDWLKVVVERLKAMYTVQVGQVFGPPVPREALDPEIDFKPEDTNRYLAAFLETLNPKENPFLRSPEEMMAASFEGTPYKLSG